MVEQSLQDQFTKVRDACLRVKSNCQGFNVAEELCMFVNFLKNDMSSLRSSAIIRKATKFVEKLEILADDLQYDESLIFIAEHSPTLPTAPTMSPPLVAKRKTINSNNNCHNDHKQTSRIAQQQPTTTIVSIIILQAISKKR